MEVPNIFYLTFSSKFLNFRFQIFLLVAEMSASFTSYIVDIISIAFVWIL